MHARLRQLISGLTAALLLVLVFLPATAPAQESGATWPYAAFYEYDRDLPFNLEERVEKDTDAYTIYHWAYDSIHDKRVTAFYLKPKGFVGPLPCYLFLHGYSGSKNDAFDAAEATAAAGYCALFIDAEYHGERKIEGKAMYSKLAYSSRDAMVQTVIDFRRGIDLLETRPDEADAERIGFAGGSMGGILGAVLASVEPRIRATALAVGGAEWGYLLKASVVAEALGLNKGDHPLDPKVFRRIVAPADPIHWAQKISPRPVLMLNAKHDILVNPLANKMLFARLNAPKKIVWFDDDHALDMDLALDYIMKFFGAYLVGDRDPMEIGVSISGHQTKPLDMDIKPLPEPWTSMPLLDRFEYDSFLPLHLESTEIKSTDTRKVKDVSFLTAHDKTVTTTLYTPTPESSVKATVVYLHEFGADRSQAASLAEDMYARNTALFALDMEYHGARAVDGRAMISPLVETSRDAIIQTVIDVRRALDFLSTLPAADKPVILMARGHIAADIALMASAVDARIQDVILLPDENPAATEKAFNQIADQGKTGAFEKAMKWADMYNFVGDPKGVHAYTIGKYDVDPALAAGARPSYFAHRNTLDDAMNEILGVQETETAQ